MRASLILISFVLAYASFAGFAGFQAREIVQAKLAVASAIIHQTGN